MSTLSISLHPPGGSGMDLDFENLLHTPKAFSRSRQSVMAELQEAVQQAYRVAPPAPAPQAGPSRPQPPPPPPPKPQPKAARGSRSRCGMRDWRILVEIRISRWVVISIALLLLVLAAALAIRSLWQTTHGGRRCATSTAAPLALCR